MIGLDGADLLDPTLDFEARAQTRGATAILAVGGRARTPRVALRGEPPMSDDEVLSRLLLGVPPARLSAFQLTGLRLAAASTAGIGADGSGLLQRARAGLGLERLRIDSDRSGGAVVEGGRNLSERAYLVARQGLDGGEPRAVLGLQVAPQIRFESDLGSRGAAAGAPSRLKVSRRPLRQVRRLSSLLAEAVELSAFPLLRRRPASTRLGARYRRLNHLPFGSGHWTLPGRAPLRSSRGLCQGSGDSRNVSVCRVTPRRHALSANE